MVAQQQAPNPTLNKIQDILTKAEALEQRLATVRQRHYATHLPRISFLTWRSKTVGLASASTHKALELAHQRVKYDAGLVGEDLLRLLFALDAIESGSEEQVRAARKRAVVQVDAAIRQCDQLRQRVAKMDKWVNRLALLPAQSEDTAPTAADDMQTAQKDEEDEEQEQHDDEEQAPTTTTAADDAMDTEEPSAQPNSSSSSQPQQATTDTKDDDDDEEEDASSTLPAPPSSPADAPTAEDKLSQLLHRARAQWSRIHPQWEEQDDGDVVLLSLRLPRVHPEHLRVAVDDKARTLSVSGIRQPVQQLVHDEEEDDYSNVWSSFFGAPRSRSRRPARSVTVTPGAWFAQELEIPAAFALARAKVSFQQGVLTVLLPRRALPPKRRLQPQRRPAHASCKSEAEQLRRAQYGLFDAPWPGSQHTAGGSPFALMGRNFDSWSPFA